MSSLAQGHRSWEILLLGLLHVLAPMPLSPTMYPHDRTVVGIPAKPVNIFTHKCLSRFAAYGISVTGMTMDPIQRELETLKKDIQSLKEQVQHLQKEQVQTLKLPRDQEPQQQLRLINDDQSTC